MNENTHVPPVDLGFLTDRARAYVMGLEAKLKEFRLRNEELSSAEWHNKKTEAALKRAYRNGWKDCANHFMNETQSLKSSLNRVREAAFQTYLQAPAEDYGQDLVDYGQALADSGQEPLDEDL